MARKICLSQSSVQAYIDAELPADTMVLTLAHIGACSKCKSVVNDAISEEQIVSYALAPEMELPVPTVRLRAQINRAIKADQ